MSTADEILKLKELLDMNIITQEEFTKKKRELLNSENIVRQSNEQNIYYKDYTHIKKTKQFNIKKIIIPIVLIIFICAILFSISNSLNNKVDIILDVNKFYNSDKSNTITKEELIKLKGTPTATENWKHEVNSKKSYAITTLSYSNNEEYHFYNGHLAWITITREFSYNKKSDILTMFGLEQTSNTKKIADNDYTLRYQNCGVADFWVTNIDNHKFNWVKIAFFDLI